MTSTVILSESGRPAGTAHAYSRGQARALAEVVRRVAADRAAWADLVAPVGPDRRWLRISVPEGVDVWAIAWPTLVATELHSRGGAWAAFTVVTGQVTELSVDGSGRLATRRHPVGRLRMVPPGGIHDVYNEAAEQAVTVHAYAPRLDEMRYYRWGPDGARLDRVVAANTETW